MSNRIGVIDYGGGNLRNVMNVLKFLGHESILVSAPDDMESLDRLIFPGVGSFGDCVAELDSKKLRDPVIDWITSDRPFLGICLGYQILFERSQETTGIDGLGIFPGEVIHFPAQKDLKVPHMGWNQVEPVEPGYTLWDQTPDPLYFYFVHSYFPKPEDPHLIASTTQYGDAFASSICRGNLFACQFHPERSQEAGLKLIDKFLAATPGKTIPL